MTTKIGESLATYTLVHKESNSRFSIIPKRGGLVTELVIQGEQLLYLDKESLYNLDVNVRGGIPILFPFSGQLPDGEYTWESNTYQMKNHGFARNKEWEIIDIDVSKAFITLRLGSDESTRQSFPFDFELIFTFSLDQDGLTIVQQYRNHSNASMPFYSGFHPYFKHASNIVSITTDASQLLDYNDGYTKRYNGQVDLTESSEGMVLLDMKNRSLSFPLRANSEKQIELHFGQEFRYIMLWSEQGKDFVCIEPWMAKTNEISRKEKLMFVEPNGNLQTYFTISVK